MVLFSLIGTHAPTLTKKNTELNSLKGYSVPFQHNKSPTGHFAHWDTNRDKNWWTPML